MNDNVEFMDPETFGSSGRDSPLSFNFIVLLHLQKLTLLASKEMRGGYYEQKPNPDKNSNVPLLVYVPDTRECYCSAVDNLSDMLHAQFDEEMRTVSHQVEQELNELTEDTKRKTSLGEIEIIHADFYPPEDKLIIEQYKQIKFSLKRKLFRALMDFLKRTDYMEIKVVAE